MVIFTCLRSHNPNILEIGVLLETDVSGKECTHSINMRESTKNGLQYAERTIKHFCHPKLMAFHADSLL